MYVIYVINFCVNNYFGAKILYKAAIKLVS